MITRTAILRLRTLARISPLSTTAYASSSLLPRTKHGSSDDEESAVYRNSMKFARPSTVTSKPHLRNSVSLIGSVEYPIKQFTKDDEVGAHTVLLVKPSPISHRHFRVTLTFWDLLAERALAHLKPNDYIYVSGVLQSYTKSVLEGTERLYYKVKAEELNYVQVPDESYLVAAKPGLQAGESAEQKSINQLHLLQVFFANPNEWYDNRDTKKSSKHPDFTHKSTGEAIWLKADDPQWVKKQLMMIDSRPTRTPSDELPFGSFTPDLLNDKSHLKTTGTSFCARKSKVIANDVQVPDESYQVAATAGFECGESLEQKHMRLLPLWQSLFADPDEWYDCRKTKENLRHPDFKHKMTGERLWLNADDPSWVKKHVELRDSGHSKTQGGEMPFGSFTSDSVSGYQSASSDSTQTNFTNDMSNQKLFM